MWKNLFKFLMVVLLGATAWFTIKTLLPPTVDVVSPTRGPAIQAVYATGTVEASVMLPIASRVSARLVQLHVDEGTLVQKGQILAQLEDTDMQNAISQLIAKRTLAQRNYDRAIALVKQGVQSRKTADETLSALQAAQADVARAEAEADYSRLTAPADGVIIKRDGEIGQLIPANTPVLWLSCCAPLRITTEVDEEDIPNVKSGQDVLIQADAFPDQVFQGTVDTITPKGDPVARSYRVRVKFKEVENIPFMIGMTAETNIIIHQNPNALLIPGTALVNNSVWALRNGRAQKIAVKIGVRDTDHVEILSGLNEDDLVINTPALKLKEGDPVSAHKIVLKEKNPS